MLHINPPHPVFPDGQRSLNFLSQGNKATFFLSQELHPTIPSSVVEHSKEEIKKFTQKQGADPSFK